jgi:hypothetical protein
MFNRGDQGRTPKQQADRAAMRLLARLGACALLVYFVIKLLLQTGADTPGSRPPAAVIVVLSALTVVVIALTVLEFIRGAKAGAYSSSTYEEADIAEYLENKKNTDGDSETNGDGGTEDDDRK